MPSAYEDRIIPLMATVDRSRPFIADSLAPLYYTPTWRTLTAEQQLTYNQISGTYWNELIAWFEMELAEITLRTMAGHQSADSQLKSRVSEFLREESLHAVVFHQLNQLSDGVRYATAPLSVIRVPRALPLALRAAAACGLAPALLWVMLLMEERSISVMTISCRSGIDDLYARVYRGHAADEAKHVSIDLDLLDVAYRSMTRTARKTNALLLESLLTRFLIRPGAAARRVVALWIAAHPELRSLRTRVIEELNGVGSQPEYRRSMYSDVMTPRTMERMRSLPEMTAVLEVLS